MCGCHMKWMDDSWWNISTSAIQWLQKELFLKRIIKGSDDGSYAIMLATRAGEQEWRTNGQARVSPEKGSSDYWGLKDVVYFEFQSNEIINTAKHSQPSVGRTEGYHRTEWFWTGQQVWSCHSRRNVHLLNFGLDVFLNLQYPLDLAPTILAVSVFEKFSSE